MMQTCFSKIKLLLAIVLINYSTSLSAAELTAVVNTTSGPVRGEQLTNVNSVKYAAFKGIRYGKAPVGYLRFKPPTAVDPWTEILDATVEGSDCPQINSFTNKFVGSEDCLFLNVMTPVTNLTQIPKNLKPVMVFIYGGGFQTGSSSASLYRPDYIIEKNVVYVAMNYRLGPLGFLSLRHCNTTGNAGLKDQVLALKWVKANIRKFGGNPKNVTIFGQSAGGISVGSHVLSKASTGLFHGAISMSGQPLSVRAYSSPAEAKIQAERLGVALGATSNSPDDLLRALYEASPLDIIKNASMMASLYTAFSPTIEDESIATDIFMSQCSIVNYLTGNFNKVPQILGFMEQEAVYYFSPLGPIIQILKGFLNSLEIYRSDWPKKIVAASKIANAWTGGELSNTELQTLINVTSDIGFKALIDLTQQILAGSNDDKPVYYYQVSYSPNVSLHNILLNNTLKGAGHVDDLAYIFYFPQANYSMDPADPTRITINRVSTMWTNFAKYGNPKPNWVHNDFLDVTWPNSGVVGTTLDIGNDLVARPRMVDDAVKFFQLVNWPLSGIVGGCHA